MSSRSWSRWLIALALSCLAGQAAEVQTLDELHASSLPLRTALHHDPSLEAPLDQLVRLYSGANQMEALVALYRNHLATYPQDNRATAVIIRLLKPRDPDQALELVQLAVQRFQKDSYLHYLHYQLLKQQGMSGDLEALAEAIELDESGLHREEWLTDLLPLAQMRDDKARVEQTLNELADLRDGQPEGMLSTAQLMIRYGHHERALEVLTKALTLSPAPETMIDLELGVVDALEAANRREDAAARLDELLSRLGPDYWRRAEIYRRRITLVQSEAERDTLLAKARERVRLEPETPAAALDLAEVLTAFELRRQAAGVLLAASKRMPESAEIEKALLKLYDRLRNWPGKAEYLAQRIELYPQREDLRFDYALILGQLNRFDSARVQIAHLLKEQPAETQVRLLLELVRLLRRNNLHREAAELLAQVLTIAPERLDVRRELAEIYLALGNAEGFDELFNAPLPAQADVTQILDLAEFLQGSKRPLQARLLLRGALDDAPVHLELRLQLIEVENQLDNRQAARELLQEARALADTEALYRRWLQAAVEFHNQHETIEVFLSEERQRLDKETVSWDERETARQLAFVETAANDGDPDALAELLDTYLARELPAQVSIRLRERRLELIKPSLANRDLYVGHLEKLLAGAPEEADLYKAQYAIFCQAIQDVQRVRTLINEIDPMKLNNPIVLSSLMSLMELNGRLDLAQIASRRLVDLDPGNLAYWRDWLETLYDDLDEVGVRRLLRQLLAGGSQLEMTDDSRELIRLYLVDSYWRSISKLMMENEPSDWGPILDLLSEAETSIRNDHQWLWGAWTRAFTLQALEQPEARDAAILELEEVAKRLRDQEDFSGVPFELTTLSFPDGLQVPLETARELLTQRPVENAFPEPVEPAGPISGNLAAKWAYDTESPICSIQPMPNGSVIISDSTRLHSVDRSSGRLNWIFGPIEQQNSWVGPCIYWPDPQVPLLLTASGNTVIAVDAATGDTRWLAETNPLQSSGSTRFHLWKDRLYAVDLVTLYLSAFDPRTGKVLAERDLLQVLPKPQTSHQSTNGSVAQIHQVIFQDGRMLVNGAHSALVDLTTTMPIWMVDLSKVRKIPLDLPRPNAGGTAQTNQSARQRTVQAQDYLATAQGRVRYGRRNERLLTSPVGMWSRTFGPGLFHGDHLLLKQHDVRMAVVNAGLPVVRAQYTVNGTFVGLAGSYLLTLGNGVLRLNLRTGQVDRIFLPFLEDKANRGHRLQAVLEGNRLYLSGPTGFACVNIATRQPIFSGEWPASVQALVDGDLLISNYQFSYMLASSGGRQAGANPVVRRTVWQSGQISYLHAGVQYNGQTQQNNLRLHLVDKVAAGWWFATPSPTHVVALVEEGTP